MTARDGSASRKTARRPGALTSLSPFASLERYLGPMHRNTLAQQPRRSRRFGHRGLGGLLAVSLAFGTTLASPPAWAGPASSAAAPSEKRAVELFEAGRYDEAIEMFQSLYDAGGSANYLYNIARIYEDDGQLAKAVEYYERFVHARGAGLEERQQAAQRAAALREILGTSGQPPDPTTTGPKEPEAIAEPSTEPPPEDSATAEPDEGEPSPADEEQPDEGEGPSTLAIAGYSLLGVGVATAAAGGVVGALALSDDRKLTSGPVRENAADLQVRGQRKALAADVLLGVGGALAITGVALVITDVVRRRRNESATAHRPWRVRSTPVLGPTMVGIGFTARM